MKLLKNVFRKTSVISTIILLSGSLVSISAQAYNVGDKVDADVLRTLNINPNKVTLVDFFASWCTSCKKELPILDNMALNSQKVEIIGVDTDKDIQKGKNFQKSLNLKMRIYNDPSQKIVSKFRPYGMPAIYYIKDGKVVNIRQGVLPKIDHVVNSDLSKIL